MTQRSSSSSVSVAMSESAAHCGETRYATPLLAFFALAFAWSWTWGLLGAALKVGSPIAATTLSMTSGFGPSLAAVVVVFYTTGQALPACTNRVYAPA